MSFSTERYKQVARACKVLEILQHSRFGKTTKELADEVVQYMGLTSVSQKSIERDIKFWQGYGFRMEPHKTNDPERRTVWMLDTSYVELPSLQISLVELLAFAAGRELLIPLAGTPYWEGIQILWSKMREALPEPLWEHFERIRPSLIVRGAAPRDYSDREGMLSTLNRAINQHRIARIAYQALDSEEAKEREIEPHAIVLFNGSIYVVATDAGVEGGSFKLFKLDRLSRVSCKDKRFKPREDFDPDELFDASIGIFCSGTPERFRIRVAKSGARWVTETPLHPKQVITHEEDGSIILAIASAHSEEIIPHVLALGEHAEVLEPASCRKRLGEIARELADRYST